MSQRERLTKQELREECIAMAKDPDIIRECIAINREFEGCLLDGLEDEEGLLDGLENDENCQSN